MATLFETAYAKINLALHVRARRSDGYHDIETLFAFVDDGDLLSAEEGVDLTLQVTGPFADSLVGNDNLVLKTANLIKAEFGVEAGAGLTLDKRLPVASGIGGGSADAAATARLLKALWSLDASDDDLAALLAPLGADIPACVKSRTAVGLGTGVSLTEYDRPDLSGLAVLLVNPRKPVSTANIFAQWDGIDKGGLVSGDARILAKQGRNDLEPIAIDLCPEIGDILDLLFSQQPIIARMSGSGATCFALFESAAQRDAAAAIVSDENIAWWLMSGLLR